MATTQRKSPQPTKKQATQSESATAKAARAAGAKQPTDYMAKVRGIVPDYTYETTFGTVSLPGYIPIGMFMDNMGMNEGEIFNKIVLEEADEESREIIKLLPQGEFEGIEGSFMDLLKSWFLTQGMDLEEAMGESQASSD